MSGEGDDEAWLYGDQDKSEEDVKTNATGAPPPTTNGDGQASNGVDEMEASAEEDGETKAGAVEAGQQENLPPASAKAEEEEEDDDDSDEDDIEITIDKNMIDAAKTSYQTLQMKKTPYSKEKKGTFTTEEFDQIGQINGQVAVDFDLESIEDKPWRKPGADITDYFNYGFTEDTWAAYCNRQKTLRVNEAGVSVMGTTPIISQNKITGISSGISNIPILGGGDLAKKAPVISSTLKTVPTTKPPDTPSGITVMTHEKRVYSNKVIGNMDFSLPPPGGFSMPPPGLPPPGIPPPVIGGGSEGSPGPAAAGAPVQPVVTDYPPPAHAFPEDDPYAAGGYEPTAEAQWSVPPPHYDTSLPPPTHNMDPYGQDSRYSGRRDRDPRSGDRPPPVDRYRDYDRDRRSRRRSRSRDRDRDRRDRDRYMDRDRGGRDRSDRDDRGERRIKKEKRSRSRSRDRSDRKRSRRDRRDGDNPEDGGSSAAPVVKEEPPERESETRQSAEPPPPSSSDKN